jgi:hypothetical protein
MATRDEESDHDRTARYLLALMFVSAIVVLGLTDRFIGRVAAIKGGYALLGILSGAAVYQLITRRRSGEFESHTTSRFRQSDGLLIRAVVALVLGAYLYTYSTGERFGAVLAVLAAGFTLVAYRLLTAGATRGVVASVAALFTVGPITRYLSTGFYFGDVDVLGHVRAIELLVETGDVASVGTAYATYSSFPGLHVVSGVISTVAGVPAYDSLMLLGTVTCLAAVVSTVHLGRVLLSPIEGVGVGLVFAILSLIQFYTSYFYPQAFATTVLVVLLYVLARRNHTPPTFHYSLSVVAVGAVLVLALAHHVTQLLLLGIVFVLYAPSAVTETDIGRRLRVNSDVPRAVTLSLAVVAGVSYLGLTRTAIIEYAAAFVGERVTDPFVSDLGGEPTVIGLGTAVPFQNATDAFVSLFYVDGIYYICLTALFVLGVVVLTTRFEQYGPIAGYVLLGLLGSLFVLRTPLINVASRLALPLAVFFAIVAGVGLAWLVGGVTNEIERSEDPRGRLASLAVIGLVVTVGVTGPLVAADDLYGLHGGPNLWETYTTPEQQVEFSERELAELRTTVSHVDRHTDSTTMLWVTREASDRFGGEERSRPNVSEAGIRTDDPLVYRTAWKEHQVGAGVPLNTLVMEDSWLDREIDASNKVYTSGSVGMVDRPDDTFLRADRAR